jgi:hypothetical protein
MTKIDVQTASVEEISTFWLRIISRMLSKANDNKGFALIEYEEASNQATAYGMDGKVFRLSINQIN